MREIYVIIKDDGWIDEEKTEFWNGVSWTVEFKEAQKYNGYDSAVREKGFIEDEAAICYADDF